MIDKELHEILIIFIKGNLYSLNDIANNNEIKKTFSKCSAVTIKGSVDYLLKEDFLCYRNDYEKTSETLNDNERLMRITVKGMVAVHQRQQQRFLNAFTGFTQFIAVWVALVALCVACSK
ncbi:MAG: hypothetical protein LIO44_00245 [Eubacterium sp.]|nr:hypothetical protein [Eubacterium sp.]